MTEHQEQITYNATRDLMVALGVIGEQHYPDWPVLLCVIEEYTEYLNKERE